MLVWLLALTTGVILSGEEGKARLLMPALCGLSLGLCAGLSMVKEWKKHLVGDKIILPRTKLRTQWKSGLAVVVGIGIIICVFMSVSFRYKYENFGNWSGSFSPM